MKNLNDITTSREIVAKIPMKSFDELVREGIGEYGSAILESEKRIIYLREHGEA